MHATEEEHAGSGGARVKAGRVELWVTQHGRGMPILLAHGFPLDHSMWDAQVSFLSQRWRPIAPDLRGFGDSQVTPGVVSMEEMADDLAALLDALGVNEPVVFCGLSMGGYVAFQFWRKYRERLRALVLCDTRAAADAPEAAEGREKQAEIVLREGTSPLVESMLPRLVAGESLEKRPQVVEALRNEILAAPAEGVAAALRGLATRPDVTDYLPRIALPTLAVVGREDAISPVDEMRGLAAAIPGAEFVVIPHSGHMSPMENPDAFNEAIEQFLTRVERGG